MLRRFIDRLAGVKPIEDPNDIGTGTDDIYVMSLDEVLRRLAQDIPADTFLDDEDDTANFEFLYDDNGGEG
jgi:aryl carrier-like protein